MFDDVVVGVVELKDVGQIGKGGSVSAKPRYCLIYSGIFCTLGISILVGLELPRNKHHPRSEYSHRGLHSSISNPRRRVLMILDSEVLCDNDCIALQGAYHSITQFFPLDF